MDAHRQNAAQGPCVPEGPFLVTDLPCDLIPNAAVAPFIDRWPGRPCELPQGPTCSTCGGATEPVAEVPGLRRCPTCPRSLP